MENIEKKITINVPVARVWKALTNADELGNWMLMPTTFKPEIGNQFLFQADANENWDGKIHCKILEIETNKKLAFTWNSQMINAETLVTIHLKDLNEKTELTLIHSGWEKLPANAEQMKQAHNEGWNLRIAEKLPQLVEKQ